MDSAFETFSSAASWPRMPDKRSTSRRREQQAREIEKSQAALRKSILETQRLMDRSDEMLERHRRERETDESGD